MSAPYETDSEAEVAADMFLPDRPLADSDSEAEVAELIHKALYDDEVEIEPDVWERHWRHMNRRRTTEEIFGNPAKRRRLQQLARDALEEEKTFGALKASRKETDNDPLQCVILEISVQ